MDAAVEHIEHRDREQRGLFVAEVAPQRLPELGGLRAGDGERDSEDRVRAEPRLGVSPVKFDQRMVESGLVAGVAAGDRIRDLTVDVINRAEHRLASVGIPAVTQLDGLVLAG